MKKNNKIIISYVLIFVSVIYTVLVKFVDVKNIGPNNSKVGFSTLNGYFSNLIKSNMLWYNITKYIGYIAILVAIIYAFIGLLQFIKRKNVFKVDKEILGLGVFYFAVICIYIFFEKCIINYRPVLIDDMLEASYPSSHTMLALCICGSALLINNKLYKNFKYTKYINIILILMMLIIIIGRIISGVHWISDIIGGILISLSLLMCFKSYLDYNN